MEGGGRVHRKRGGTYEGKGWRDRREGGGTGGVGCIKKYLCI